jgi:hypothetical protein
LAGWQAVAMGSLHGVHLTERNCAAEPRGSPTAKGALASAGAPSYAEKTPPAGLSASTSRTPGDHLTTEQQR